MKLHDFPFHNAMFSRHGRHKPRHELTQRQAADLKYQWRREERRLGKRVLSQEIEEGLELARERAEEQRAADEQEFERMLESLAFEYNLEDSHADRVRDELYHRATIDFRTGELEIA